VKRSGRASLARRGDGYTARRAARAISFRSRKDSVLFTRSSLTRMRPSLSALPEIEQNKVADSLRNILEIEQKTWVNEEEGVFEYPYETTVVTIRRK